MNRPTASVIVPSRGGAHRLPVLFGALEAQDTDDFEVIVVADGDVDGTAAVVDEWSSRLPVRVIVFPENRGRSVALNTGAGAALGDVLIRADDDLEPSADYVSRHLDQHRQGDVGAIGIYLNQLPDTPYARSYGRAADIRFRSEALAAPRSMQWRYWAGNVSVAREVHERIGGYDERYRRYGWEDVDYGYRLHRGGVDVRIVPELSTTHHVAASTTTIRALRALHSGAARETFVGVHGPDALPLPHPGRDVWGRLVDSASGVATERTIRAYGAAVDVISRVAPRALSEKLVALGVESAGLAGIRHPQRARSRF